MSIIWFKQAGKYAMGMICYLCYCYWRHQSLSNPTIVDTYLTSYPRCAPYRQKLHPLVLHGNRQFDIWVCLGKSPLPYVSICFDNHGIFASQDFLMDWSVCKPHARYPLLRTELVYKSQIPVRFSVLTSSTPLTKTYIVLLLCFGTIANLSLSHLTPIPLYRCPTCAFVSFG